MLSPLTRDIFFQTDRYDACARWRSEDVTNSQRARLKEMGIPLPSSDPTRGQVSDFIAENSAPDPQEIAVLAFFGVQVDGLNQLQARKRIWKVLVETGNRQKWLGRPATAEQIAELERASGAARSNLTWEEAASILSAGSLPLPQYKEHFGTWTWVLILLAVAIATLAMLGVPRVR